MDDERPGPLERPGQTLTREPMWMDLLLAVSVPVMGIGFVGMGVGHALVRVFVDVAVLFGFTLVMKVCMMQIIVPMAVDMC